MQDRLGLEVRAETSFTHMFDYAEADGGAIPDVAKQAYLPPTQLPRFRLSFFILRYIF